MSGTVQMPATSGLEHIGIVFLVLQHSPRNREHGGILCENIESGNRYHVYPRAKKIICECQILTYLPARLDPDSEAIEIID